MIKVLYIGDLSEGSTSKMRCDALCSLSEIELSRIDISVPFDSSCRLFRSLAFRYKIGPVIWKVNQFIQHTLDSFDLCKFNLIWIDKGVYILPTILKKIKVKNPQIKLIHFTPDPAFYFHRSRIFFSSIPIYDVCVTTKSFEVHFYEQLKSKRIILTTQGYSAELHRKTNGSDKKYDCCFIGHYEKNRDEIIQSLIDSEIQVFLAGINWDGFVRKNRSNKNLIFGGVQLLGSNYTDAINESKIGLGLLSKWIPELHTTRTFEIPACGTVLATEWNHEIGDIFSEKEVLFFNNIDDLVIGIKKVLTDLNLQKGLAKEGHDKVVSGGFDYESIVKRIISEL